MKKSVLLSLLLLLAVSLSAQVTENPKFKARSGSVYTITRVERTAEVTRLYVNATINPAWSINIGRKSYLEDVETGKRYALKGAEGIETDKDTYMPESGQMDFVLIYEPLSPETKLFNFIETPDKGDNTYGISLVNDGKKKAPPLEAVRGNWFDPHSGAWTVGIYDSITVLNNRIYSHRQVRKRGKGIELTLLDRQNGDSRTVLAIPLRGGMCKLVAGNEQRLLTHTQRRPTVVSDNGYEKFFHTDTACLQGYIEGYDRCLGFETGIIYMRDLLTEENWPVVVPIAPDGTFSCKLLLQHAMSLAVVFENECLPFYIEPGQTQTIHLNWEGLLAWRRAGRNKVPGLDIDYMGGGAGLSYLSKTLGKEFKVGYSFLRKAQMTQTPAQFKESIKPIMARWQQVGDSLTAVYQSSQKAVGLIRRTRLMNEGMAYFDYAMPRVIYAEENPDNEALKVKTDEAFYDFLPHMPIDDPEVLACFEVWFFINRFQYMEIFGEHKHGFVSDESMPEEEYDEKWFLHELGQKERLDSLVEKLCGKPQPFLWQLAGLYEMDDDLMGFASYDRRRLFVDRQKKLSKDYPVLVSKIDDIFSRVQAEERNKSYELPEGKATDIFRNIIKEHAGKVLFVDFWATTCGPCRSAIESTAELRRKYRDHPDFKFIFITGENDSPRGDYEKYVEQHLKGEASYYVSSTEFNYLRQLFKINGIPHCELVEKDGTISVERMRAESLYYYLPERFPLNE